MKNRKKIILVTVEIIALIIFVFSFVAYNNTRIQPVYMFAFNRNIEAGVKVTEKDIIQVPVSKMTVTSDMIPASDYNSVIGMYTTTKVFGNTLSYRQQLGELNVSDKFASMDLSNLRVISLPIDFIEGVAGAFEKGDRVDILFKGQGQVTNAIQGEQSEFVYSKIFMQDIPVYQVNTPDGYRFVQHADSTPGEKFSEEVGTQGEGELSTGNATGGQAIGSLSLVVTPEQAEQIEARRLSGDIKFVKRFPESQTHETLGFVIGNYGKVFSGNANAETGSLQIIENFLDEEPDNKLTDEHRRARTGEVIKGDKDGTTQNSGDGVSSGFTGVD